MILERSGIGSREVLEKSNIPLVAEVPGVGANYQGKFGVLLVGIPLTASLDHALYITAYFADPDLETFDPIFRDDKEALPKLIERWEKDGGGFLGGKYAMTQGFPVA